MVTPLVVVLEDPTSLSATVAGPLTRLRPTRSYTTLWDVTQVLQLDWAEMPTRPWIVGGQRVCALVASLPYSGA